VSRQLHAVMLLPVRCVHDGCCAAGVGCNQAQSGPGFVEHVRYNTQLLWRFRAVAGCLVIQRQDACFSCAGKHKLCMDGLWGM
jgi:hypothetical protein